MLAIMDEVRDQDASACAAIFGRILLHNPLYTNLALTNRTGDVVASAVPMAFSSLADRRALQGRAADQSLFSR